MAKPAWMAQKERQESDMKQAEKEAEPAAVGQFDDKDAAEEAAPDTAAADGGKHKVSSLFAPGSAAAEAALAAAKDRTNAQAVAPRKNRGRQIVRLGQKRNMRF